MEARSATVSRATAEMSTPTKEKAPEVATRKVCIVTGASSGVGLYAAKALADRGWFVVMANRDFMKSKLAAQRVGIPETSYKVIHCDLGSLDSVRKFVYDFQQSGMPLDALVCNAAVYKPLLMEPERTADGFELCVGTNHLSHFLLCNLLLEDLAKSKNKPRCVILGTVTHNPNEIGGKIPPQANLGDLQGLAKGMKGATSMIDGKAFSGPKAYKDSKVCNVLTMRELHKRYHRSKNIIFTSLYPGCVADTALFRNHTSIFQTLFAPFHKTITRAYVTQELAGARLADLVTEDDYTQSGAYYSWGGPGSANRDSFIQRPSDDAADAYKGEKMWEYSAKLVGLSN